MNQLFPGANINPASRMPAFLSSRGTMLDPAPPSVSRARLLGVGASLAVSSACSQEQGAAAAAAAAASRLEGKMPAIHGACTAHLCPGLGSWEWAPRWQCHQPACRNSTQGAGAARLRGVGSYQGSCAICVKRQASSSTCMQGQHRKAAVAGYSGLCFSICCTLACFYWHHIHHEIHNRMHTH
jgi:hypothetical protein